MRFGDVLELQEQVERAFRDAIAAGKARPAVPSFAPPTDVTRTMGEYVVRCDLPGVTAEDVRVVADEGVLRIAGRRQPPAGRLLRSERKAGSFARVIPLPSDADVSKVSASLRQGVLTVTVGRLEARPKGPVEVPVRVETG